ncbi:MAG: PEP-CTERM sorting domain-containing protein [Verrucomicrobiae bacterium]|nr:PEP-CTERM sorting domain-containing protein [Verrucomicrobiae bacterium]NNJ87409.1 PEP-CTERM sorting domain-containing protein [Akkermansiaceae bacterium]
MKQKTTSLIYSIAAVTLLSSMPSLHSATIVPDSYAFDGPAGSDPTGTAGGVASTLLSDDVISTGAWNDGDNVYFNAGDTPAASMTFTFDDTYKFSTIVIYEHTQLINGIANVDILTSVNGTDFSSATNYAIGAGTAVGGTAHAVEHSLDVSSLADAQYIRFNFVSAGGSWMTLTEIDFDGTAIPEPSTAILGGLGLLALLRRRR